MPPTSTYRDNEKSITAKSNNGGQIMQEGMLVKRMLGIYTVEINIFICCLSGSGLFFKGAFKNKLNQTFLS